MIGKDNSEVKIFITFESISLPELSGVLNPMDVMLVVTGKNTWEAREKVFTSFVGNNFCTSYDYDMHAQDFKDSHGAREYTLEELERLVIVSNSKYKRR